MTEATTQESFLEKLKLALGLVESLKAENETLKDNFEKISEKCASVQSKNDKIQKDLSVAVNEKNILEDNLTKVRGKLKESIHEQQKEIERIKREPPTSKELEMLKLEMQEDLEQSQQAKVSLIENECTKFRSLYYKTRREWDAAEVENQMKLSELNLASDEMKRGYEDDIARLHKQIQDLKQSVDDTTHIERFRAVQREKSELEIRVKSMIEEIEQVRSEKEALRLASEQQERNYKRQLADQISASKGFHSEKETLQSKCNIMEDEFRSVERRLGEIMEENSRLKKELDKNTSSFEEATHRYNTDLSNNQMNLLKQKNEFQHHLGEYKSKIATLMTELKTSQELVQSLRDRLAAQEKDYSDKLRLASEDHWAKVSLLEAEKANKEKELAALKQKYGDLELQNDAENKELERELQRLKKELQAALAMADSLKESNNNLIVDKDQNSIALEQSRVRAEELGLSLQDSSNQIDGLKLKIRGLQEQNSALDSKAQSLSNDIAHLTEQANREAEAYEHTLERQNMKSQQDRQKLEQQLELANRDRNGLIERIKALENVLERQQQLFESKITLLQERVRRYKDDQIRGEQRKEEIRKKQAGMLQFLNAVQPVS